MCCVVYGVWLVVGGVSVVVGDSSGSVWFGACPFVGVIGIWALTGYTWLVWCLEDLVVCWV